MGINKISNKNRKNNKLSKEISYFISSLSSDNKPSFFSKGIRNHWSIENGLHYVKDVTFREDASKIKTGNAPENMSLFRNISINIFKKQKLNNSPYAKQVGLTVFNMKG